MTGLVARLGLAAVVSTGLGGTAQSPTVWPDPASLRELFDAQGVNEAYDPLRQRLADCGRLYRADGTAQATTALLADPLRAAAHAVDWTDRILAAVDAEPAAPFELWRLGAELLDREAPDPSLGAALAVEILAEAEAGDDVLGTRLDLAERLCSEAAAEVDYALREIPVDERAELAERLKALLNEFVATVYVTKDEGHTATWKDGAARVDHAALLRAAAWLMPLTRGEFWEPLKKAARRAPTVPEHGIPGVEGRVLAVRETPFGKLVVGGPGDNVWPDVDALLLVDTGGDDVYRGACCVTGPERPVSVLVDLWGDDVYEASEDGFGAQAAGLLGTALLVDLRGDDRYVAGRLAQGAALCGVGLLLDVAGDDQYAADACVQGAAVCGYASLLDLDGRDGYVGRLYAQGFGGPWAVGVLCDRAGADRYEATGRYPSSYGTAGEFQGFSQGAAVGLRTLTATAHHVAGGFGMLVDGGGDDECVVGEFGYGVGYFLGTGIVRDRGGDDRVDGSRYGIATGAHQAVGIVLDDAGDDVRTNPHTASLAGNWDHTVSILVDAAGDDRYAGGGITLGSATITSFAALIDCGGTDHYDAAGSGLSLGTCGHPTDLRNQTRSVALFADLGGTEDSYTRTTGDPAPGDDQTVTRRRTDTFEDRTDESGIGVFVDR